MSAKLKAKGAAKRTQVFATLALAATLAALGASAAHARPALWGGEIEAVRLAGDMDGGHYGNRYEDRSYSREAIERFHDKVDWAQSRGALNRREAARLHFKADALKDLARAYWRRDGMDWYARRDLDGRFSELRGQFRQMVWDRDYRGGYRDEWRESRMRDEPSWRGQDDRSQSYANRDDDASAPDLRGRSEDRTWQNDVQRPQSNSEISQPKPYRSPNSVAPSQPSEQPFKDGRDFH